MNLFPLDRLADALQRIAPLQGSAPWDNTGWLIRLPKPTNIQGLMLCIDLSRAVVAEAVRKQCQVVVCYHPPLFHPVKRLDTGVGMQAAILEAVARGIHLYSPHTALDAAPGGLNDWLAGLAGPGDVERFPAHGARLVRLNTGLSTEQIARRYREALGSPCVRLVPGRGVSLRAPLREIAVCAGSGGSALREVAGARLWVTGEMSHHDLLAAREAGVTVLLSEHTRTERPYLPVYAQRIRSETGFELRVVISRRDEEIVRYFGLGPDCGETRRKTRNTALE